MNQDEIDLRVANMRACFHARHYLDDDGTLRCFACQALVRSNPDAVMMVRETRTLTNGWIQPMFEFMRNQENRMRAELKMALLTDEPEIRHQERWVSDWQDRT